MPQSRRSRQNPAIREFLLDQIDQGAEHVVSRTAAEFGISRPAAHKYLSRLIDEGLVTARGKTRARTYALSHLVDQTFTIELSQGLPEHHIWTYRVAPLLQNVPENITAICQYGFTEILNNAIDHSASATATVHYRQNSYRVWIAVLDRGIGIFEKIQRDFHLADHREALLELSKGRITSNPRKHAGEGIFFTSRMFELFRINSGRLTYVRTRRDSDDWLIEAQEKGVFSRGTYVDMGIPLHAKWTKRNVFEQYENNEIGFRKTHVPVRLGNYPGEQLVSRSQAKRILSRFEKFSEVMLDFEGVSEIGPAFADEIFRVFTESNPNVRVIAVRTNPAVRDTIDQVQSNQLRLPLGPSGDST